MTDLGFCSDIRAEIEHLNNLYTDSNSIFKIRRRPSKLACNGQF